MVNHRGPISWKTSRRNGIGNDHKRWRADNRTMPIRDVVTIRVRSFRWVDGHMPQFEQENETGPVVDDVRAR